MANQSYTTSKRNFKSPSQRETKPASSADKSLNRLSGKFDKMDISGNRDVNKILEDFEKVDINAGATQNDNSAYGKEMATLDQKDSREEKENEKPSTTTSSREVDPEDPYDGCGRRDDEAITRLRTTITKTSEVCDTWATQKSKEIFREFIVKSHTQNTLRTIVTDFDAISQYLRRMCNLKPAEAMDDYVDGPTQYVLETLEVALRKLAGYHNEVTPAHKAVLVVQALVRQN